jgi:glutamate synthase (NADPH/NADH) large chain/glutamate synthase (ferredoxin)
MSGGLAFVLDEDGTFRERVNPALLDQLEELDEGDAIEVRDLVAEHVRRTGSSVGRRVLEDLEALLPRFVKVFPADYKRVLQEFAAQEAEAAEGRAGTLAEGEPAKAHGFAPDTVDVVGAPDMLGEGA